jgi:iron(III) transport system ATP-binding protein
MEKVVNVLQAENLSKTFGSVPILRNLCLTIAKGEVVALLGVSGSGKSTFARLACGSLASDDGRVIVSGKSVNGLDEARPISYMPQEEGFWATLSVRRQLALVLHSPRARFPREEGIRQLAEDGKLMHRLSAWPSELSGGELRRLAFLRAIAVTCELLILDEPFSGVDESTEAHLQSVLRKYVDQIRCGVLMISHDFDHALLLADRAAVLHRGAITQKGTPLELLRSPKHGSVLRVLGAINVWPACISGEDSTSVRTSVGDFPLPHSFAICGPKLNLAYSVPHESVQLGIGTPGVRGTVVSAIPGSKALRLTLRNDDGSLLEIGLSPTHDKLKAVRCGSMISLKWAIDDAILINDED